MAVEDWAEWIVVLGFGECLDCLHGGEGLETEFTAEAWLDLVVLLEGGAAMPDSPVVHVAVGVALPVVGEVVGAGAW